MNYSGQRFIVLDPKTGQSMGVKKRIDVHRDGDWHLAANAFIIRKNKNGSLEVLTQERSKYVDIASNKIDQSLAIQVTVKDKGLPEKAILRGLKEELGIEKKNIKTLSCFNSFKNWQIIKRYNYNRDLWNRELVTSFGVVLGSNNVSTDNIKVEKISWLGWDYFCELVKIKPNEFTKTVRMFCVFDKVSKRLEDFLVSLLEKKIKEPIKNKYYYFSFYSSDIIVFQRDNRNYDIQIYDTSNSMKLKEEYLNVRNLPDKILEKGVEDESIFYHYSEIKG